MELEWCLPGDCNYTVIILVETAIDADTFEVTNIFNHQYLYWSFTNGHSHVILSWSLEHFLGFWNE